MGGIFISYRREDSGPYAGRLRDALSRHFGADQVFRDVDRINPGERFPRVIEQQLGSCQALLAVIGPSWLSIKDDAGRHRLDDPDDYVRLEIAAALGRGAEVLVIPVLVGPASMPAAADLPKPLASLAECNAVRVSDETWEDQVARLTRELDKVVERSVQHGSSGPWTKVRVVGSIPQPAPNFQQRTTILAAVAALEETGPRPGQFVVSGMGGVGKTQLAVAFARELISRNQVSLVVWVPASSRTGVVTAYAAAAATVDVGADKPEQACARFLGWLSSTDRRWAIILDDVSDPADLHLLWPPDQPLGTTVVTSRRRDASLVAGRNLIDVDVFTVDQARTYLSERLTPDLADDVDGIAADLGYLPLALSHAAAHLVDLELPASMYRQQFANRKRQLPKLFPSSSALFDGGTSTTIATTWSMSIEQADDQEPMRLARPLLALASMLDPNGIPTAVFDAAATRDYLAVVTTTGEASSDDEDVPDPADTRAGLANLRRFNLISTADSVVRVHALVQRAVRETLPPDQLNQVVRCAADALLQTWPPAEHRADSALVVLLRSNTGVLGELLDAANLWERADSACDVLLRSVESISNAGLAQAAFDAATRLHEQTNRRLGPDHRATLKARHHIADCTGELGDPAGAVRAYEALLIDDLRALGPDDRDTLHTRSNLAYRRAEAGDPSGAAEAFAELLEDYTRLLGPDEEESLMTRLFLAQCRGEAGDAHGAAQALRGLLQDQLRVLRPTHNHTMITRNRLAEWLGASGDAAGAVAMLEHLVTDRLAVLGAHHVATLGARTSLAEWHGRAGDPGTAVSMLEAVASDRTRLLGAHHLSTLTTRRELIRWRGEGGDAAGAVAELALLLADMEGTIAREHPDILRTRCELARWRARAGDLPGATALLEDVLNSQNNVHGPTHPETLTTRTELASCLGAAGQATHAMNELSDVLAVRTQVLGPDHPDTLATRGAIARWRGESGDPLGAYADLEKLLKDCMHILGPRHPQTAAVEHDIEYWRARSDSSR